ncbi:hypothetical protein [Nocardia donostiensis]|uniref:hypothetical protein n=1 Tax=Nocardia donostiensis TaxID=1538463 RepID=UPI0011155E07|nr:hypothetical protein [Nocardia donostiensis]
MFGSEVVRGQFTAPNRYATECGRCSVLVRPDCGIICGDPTYGQLMCVTCVARRDNPDAEFPFATAGAGNWVTVALMGFTRACWRCRTDVVCVAGMYPHRPGQARTG